MTQEDRYLLIKDLSARLPYGVEIQVNDWTLLDTTLKIGHINRLQNDDIELKPYLRPMSSMTEGEINEFHKLRFIHVNYGLELLQCVLSVNEIDWLNAHHFDYRNLIEKGLAIEVTKDNNPYKDDL